MKDLFEVIAMLAIMLCAFATFICVKNFLCNLEGMQYSLIVRQCVIRR